MTKPYYQDDEVTLYHGDCVEVLRTLPDNSVDAVVTDPPYGLEFMGKDWDAPWKRADALAAGRMRRENLGDVETGIAEGTDPSHPFGDGRTRVRYGAGGAAAPAFQTWCTEWAAECLRVLKPGGHLLAFGGTRMWHRLAAAIEDAGFEIRDSIAWLYGSGFPKSLDVSKAIDKRRDDEEDIRRVCRWLRARIDDHPTETIRTIAERFGFHSRMVEHWAARDTDSQPTIPTLTQWDQLRDLLAFDDKFDAEVYRLNLRKGEPGEAWSDRPIVGTVTEWADRTNYALTSRDGLRRGEATNPVARRWQGWGTALKPAFEPIVVARKPLAGTVAANVLEHGTGALNIDACRIAATDKLTAGRRTRNAPIPGDDRTETGKGAMYAPGHQFYYVPNDAGRWPTNVVLDDAQAAELDAQSGVSVSRKGKPRAGANGDGWGMTATGAEYDDEGGASRFFPVFRYEAKAPGAERPSVVTTKLRLRADLTPEQVDHVVARLREAGVEID
ncbi:DNA methyltransferase [Mycobacterium phage Brusacoram]|nr:DNA methyltransferase [Mycobacterium phage Brusacoram]AKY02581.1 DNA methylase [Mycobacterium phage Brusacoram]